MMHPQASLRLGHALQAISSIQRYIVNAPWQESLIHKLTRSPVERQLGIVQEALRVALVEESFPTADLAGCRRPARRLRSDAGLGA